MRWLICLGVVLAGCDTVKVPCGASAIKAITIIHTAQVQYYSAHGRFAASLQELDPLTSGTIDGNRFAVAATPTGYMISAAQDQRCTSGSRTYFSDQTMGIRVHFGNEPATVNDPLLGE